MKLHSLLPIGRAFAPAADRSGRYRQAEPGWWTRLGGVEPRLPGRERGVGAAPMAVAERAEAGRAPGPETPAGKMPGAGLRPVARRRLPLWLEQLLLLLVRPGNRRRGSRPVQTEMCFESVKVARNDLTTADVEVVVPSAGGLRARLSPACRRRLVRLWWDQGTRRLRQLGNTLF